MILVKEMHLSRDRGVTELQRLLDIQHDNRIEFIRAIHTMRYEVDVNQLLYSSFNLDAAIGHL